MIEQMPDVRSAAAGFLVRTGARDERAELAGKKTRAARTRPVMKEMTSKRMNTRNGVSPRNRVRFKAIFQGPCQFQGLRRFQCHFGAQHRS